MGLKNLGGRILGSNTLIQGALPDILNNTPQSYFDSVIEVLYVSFSSLLLNTAYNYYHNFRTMPNWRLTY